MSIIADWARETWQMTLEAAPWLLGGFLLAGVVYVLVPVGKVTRHLGKPGFVSVLKAALFGIPLPLCSCSVIPVASSIRKQGASRGAFVSFLISTPETGVDSFAISYVLLGPLLAVARPVAAFVTAITAGLLIGRSGDEHPGEDAHEDAGSCCREGAKSTEPIGRNKIAVAFRYGLVDLITDLSPWLVLGFALAGLAAAIIPEGFLERHVGSGLPAMLLMSVIGLPLYVCATSSTPVAAALIARGLSPGAALVFLLVGPATNLATMVIVSRDLGKRGLAVYLMTIAVVAISFGMIIDAVFPLLSISPATMTGHHEHSVSLIAWPAAVVLTLLTLNGLRLRLVSRLRRRAAAPDAQLPGRPKTETACHKVPE